MKSLLSSAPFWKTESGIKTLGLPEPDAVRFCPLRHGVFLPRFTRGHVSSRWVRFAQMGLWVVFEGLVGRGQIS